jgi:SUKH superfamily protein
MSLDALVSVLPPPDAPVDAGSPAGWAAVEAELGTALPADYKAFVERYGSGVIGDFIRPFNPFSTNPNRNLKVQAETQLDALRQIQRKYPDEVPFPLFPEEGGYLPWGRTDNGDILHWKTAGPPDSWTAAVSASRDPEHQEFAEDMTSFLARLLRKEISTAIFPRSFPPASPAFLPVKS